MATSKKKKETAALPNSLLEVSKQLSEKYGDNVLLPGSMLQPIRRIKLHRLPMLDYVMGGGRPVNRIVEYFGVEPSGGKSLASYFEIAAFQHTDWNTFTQDAFERLICKPKKHKSKGGGFVLPDVQKVEFSEGYSNKNYRVKYCVLIDMENTYDKDWGEKCGINNDALIHVVPERGSDAINITEAFLSSPDVCLIVFDSMSVAAHDAEIDAPIEDEQMAINARFWNKATRKFQSALNSNEESDISLTVINRAYSKVDFFGGTNVANGSGMKFAKSVSVEFRPQKPLQVKKDGLQVDQGKNVVLKNRKNKTATPFLSGSFYISFIEDGYLEPGDTDVPQQLMDLGIRCGVIKRKGAYFSFGRYKEQGAENFKQLLFDKDLLPRVEKMVHKKLYGKLTEDAEESA